MGILAISKTIMIKQFLLIILCISAIVGCKPRKKLVVGSPVASETITTTSVKPVADSAQFLLNEARKANISVRSASGKIAIQSQKNDNRNPDGVAHFRLYTDSVLWVSVTSSMLNLEVARLYIWPHEVVFTNRLNQTYWRCLLYTSPSPRD